jgi:hypothetical protein
MTNLSTYRVLPRWALVARFALVGLFAGLLAWVSVFGLRLLAGEGGPTITSLLWAMPRGALFGAILALILHAWWRSHPSK